MKNLTKVGLTITVVWFLVIAGLIWWKFEAVIQLTPNEWGDLLSGVTAPLALIWLVIGYFLQGEELRLNTAALKAQEEELRNQVKETAVLAANSARHALADEQLALATKDEYERIADRDFADSQPVFRARGGAPSTGPNPQFFTEIENVGATVTKLKAETRERGVTVQIDGAEVLSQGNTTMLVVSGAVKFPYYFGISFVDAVGDPQSQDFKMTTQHSIERVWGRVYRLGVVNSSTAIVDSAEPEGTKT